MKIFAISGLGADERVFQYLSLNAELVHVKWLAPKNKEPIEAYAKRLVEKYQIGKEKHFGLLGVSFGGLVAVEISKLVQPSVTVLISSVETRTEIRPLIRYIGKTKIIELLPPSFLRLPKPLAQYLFGTKKKDLLHAILDDSDPHFTKWALRELMNWNNKTKPPNLINISGTKDKLLPPKVGNNYLIQQGQHFMIVDRAKEISTLINQQLTNIISIE